MFISCVVRYWWWSRWTLRSLGVCRSLWLKRKKRTFPVIEELLLPGFFYPLLELKNRFFVQEFLRIFSTKIRLIKEMFRLWFFFLRLYWKQRLYAQFVLHKFPIITNLLKFTFFLLQKQSLSSNLIKIRFLRNLFISPFYYQPNQSH